MDRHIDISLDIQEDFMPARRTTVQPQQAQQQVPPMPGVAGPRVSLRFKVPDDQLAHLPRRSRAPQLLPLNAPLPRVGEFVYLSSTSAWGVQAVVHEWLTPLDLSIEVWLTHVGAARERRATGFAQTQ